MGIWNNSYPNFQFKNIIQGFKVLPNGSIDYIDHKHIYKTKYVMNFNAKV